MFTAREREKKSRNHVIIPFLMNFSSDDSWATMMSISPIMFLMGVHSQGTPVEATPPLLCHYFSSDLTKCDICDFSDMLFHLALHLGPVDLGLPFHL